MSDYIVTARKWRPMKFDDVAAQHHVTTTLRNAVAQGRLAHAYLFSGPRGVGKTTTARLLAKVVNCLHPVDNNPDNECEVCKEITDGRSFDVLEIDGASNRGVEEIRNLRESVRYGPARGKYKVYIIDEVHMLTKEAFNALLKTLEEPPSHALFIFATTEIHKVPATILSRCQRFDFRRISIDEIVTNLKGIASVEGLLIDDDALILIAKKGDGSLRDAQSIFDQVVALCGKQITQEQILQALHIVGQELYFRFTDLIKAKDTSGGLALVDEIMNRGYDIKEFLSGLIEHLRNILVATTTGSTSLIETSEVYRKRYTEEAKTFSPANLLRLIRLAIETDANIRWSAQPRFKLEADMIQMISMADAQDVGNLLQRLDEMKKKLDEVGVTTVAPMRSATAGQSPYVAPTVDSAARNPSPINDGKPAAFARSVPVQSPMSRQNPPLSEDEVRSRWSEFINEVRRQRISLGSVLESSTLVGASGGAIRIGCANEFQASSIKRNKDLLAEIIHKIFNTPARLEVETTPGAQSVDIAKGTDPPAKGAPPEDQHPVIKALMSELGAEPI